MKYNMRKSGHKHYYTQQVHAEDRYNDHSSYSTRPMHKNPDAVLQTFENPAPGKDYTIDIETQEFTCLCPITGQPDFATVKIEYVPDLLCLELKSLKNYFWSFRNRNAFHEKVCNEILQHLCTIISPRFMRLTTKFNVRGGLYTTITVEHRTADG